MDFRIINADGSCMKYGDILPFITEIINQINDCMDNGGTYFSVSVEADASCFKEDKE